MLQEAVREAPTLEAAKKAALEALSLAEDEADIEILEAPSRGFLGVFGRRQAKVRVTPKKAEQEVSALAELEALSAAENPPAVEISPKIDEPAAAVQPAENAVPEMPEPEENREPESEESEKNEESSEVIARGRKFLQDLLQAMDVQAEMTEEERTYGHAFLLRGEQLGGLIGKHGQTLEALQYLLTLASHRGAHDGKTRLLVDVENYRARREEALQNLAIRLAAKAVHTGHIQALEPMNRHERKVIHLTLQDDPRVQTRSTGEEPFRRVLIELAETDEHTKTKA